MIPSKNYCCIGFPPQGSKVFLIVTQPGSAPHPLPPPVTSPAPKPLTIGEVKCLSIKFIAEAPPIEAHRAGQVVSSAATTEQGTPPVARNSYCTVGTTTFRVAINGTLSTDLRPTIRDLHQRYFPLLPLLRYSPPFRGYEKNMNFSR